MGVEREEEFTSDNELKSLLERWVAPGPSGVLDKRIETSFAREFSGADGLSQSVLLPHRREEVVSMKFCSVCKEEFADKFSFCPVDGTPLQTVAPPVEDPSVTVNRDPSVTVNRDTVAEPAAAFTNTAVESEPDWVASSNTSSALALRGEYHLTFLDDSGLGSRLMHEFKDTAHQYELTWPEFKRDPFGFTKRAFVGYGQKFRQFLGKPNVLVAMGASVLAIVALVVVVMLMDRSHGATSSRVGLIVFSIFAGGLLVALFSTWLGRERGAAVMGAEPSDSRSVVAAMVTSFVFLFAILGIIVGIDYRNKQKELLAQNEPELQVEQMIDIPDEQPTPDPGTAGLNKGNGGGSKPKQERPGGGGGGGREEAKPASFGKVPQASLEVPQVVAPDPKPVLPKNPALPVAATVVADPMLVPPDARVLPYGDYKSKSTDPSSGPGTGNGIGTGTGGGIGPGEGGGLGPGRGGNIGGGDFNAGGGGPGGGGGGDYSRIFTGKDVTTKARLISKPEPQYTEDARKNQITGTVVLKVVFASNGSVQNIRTVSGLPYGLTERAIAAARQIKFVPATKDGHQVSMWMQLEYNFNLY
ncbi:MAG TPA: energy transducer TonB [Pyrinomonadaceae bacterium]|nr:energy transducer TonB [Pyrinomonadaceae bacterium]